MMQEQEPHGADLRTRLLYYFSYLFFAFESFQS